MTKPTSTLGILNINLSRLGDPTQTGTDVPGVVFQGTSSGDLTGYAVSTAGDFNNDGINDIMIGSPDANNGSGRVDLIYGQPASSPAGHLVGTFQLGNLPSTINSVTFLGSSGSLAGYSLAPFGAVNANPVNNIMIGAPGFNGDSGEVIVIPGNPNLSGSFALDQGAVRPPPCKGPSSSTAPRSRLEPALTSWALRSPAISSPTAPGPRSTPTDSPTSSSALPVWL